MNMDTDCPCVGHPNECWNHPHDCPCRTQDEQRKAEAAMESQRKNRRDRFAAAALAAMLTHDRGLATQREKIVCGAVAYADALIAELDKAQP